MWQINMSLEDLTVQDAYTHIGPVVYTQGISNCVNSLSKSIDRPSL